MVKANEFLRQLHLCHNFSPSTCYFDKEQNLTSKVVSEDTRKLEQPLKSVW